MAQEIKLPELVNAQAMARKYPETFFVPAPHRLDELQPGDTVMIGSAGVFTNDPQERFRCVLVRRAEDGEWIAEVKNHLYFSHVHRLAWGDLVKFSTDHIHQIEGDPDDQP
jgi:hypothetical protein